MKLISLLAAGLLTAGGAAAQTGGAQDANRCKAFLSGLQVVTRPEVGDVLVRRDATVLDLVNRILDLAGREYPDAQYAVGLMLQSGQCAQKDLPAALEMIIRAADGGVEDAQRMLAFNYTLGPDTPPALKLDVKPDPARGYMWFLIVDDRDALGKLAPRLTDAQIVEARKLAAEWRAKYGKK
jgi:TPR repeat protein